MDDTDDTTDAGAAQPTQDSKTITLTLQPEEVPSITHALVAGEIALVEQGRDDSHPEELRETLLEALDEHAEADEEMAAALHEATQRQLMEQVRQKAYFRADRVGIPRGMVDIQPRAVTLESLPDHVRTEVEEQLDATGEIDPHGLTPTAREAMNLPEDADHLEFAGHYTPDGGEEDADPRGSTEETTLQSDERLRAALDEALDYNQMKRLVGDGVIYTEAQNPTREDLLDAMVAERITPDEARHLLGEDGA